MVKSILYVGQISRDYDITTFDSIICRSNTKVAEAKSCGTDSGNRFVGRAEHFVFLKDIPLPNIIFRTQTLRRNAKAPMVHRPYYRGESRPNLLNEEINEEPLE